MTDPCFFVFRGDVEYAAEVVAVMSVFYGVMGYVLGDLLRRVVEWLGDWVRRRAAAKPFRDRAEEVARMRQRAWQRWARIERRLDQEAARRGDF